MPKDYAHIKKQLAADMQRKRQEERLARKVSTDFDSRCTELERAMKETNENAAGLTATLEAAIEGNKQLVDSVLMLMDTAKIKDGPNTTRRRLEKLEAKHGKNRGR